MLLDPIRQLKPDARTRSGFAVCPPKRNTQPVEKAYAVRISPFWTGKRANPQQVEIYLEVVSKPQITSKDKASQLIA